MQIRMKLWVERNGEVIFGEGRQKLLEAVVKTGSLAGAARELSMSYRAAWGRLKASEKRLGFPLVERGPKGKRGLVLTEAAHKIMKLYAELQQNTSGVLRKAESEWPDNLDTDSEKASS